MFRLGYSKRRTHVWGNIMSKGLAKSALLAAALLSVSPAAAQSFENQYPIKIGVMDLKANEMTYKEDGVSINYREFNDTIYDSGSAKPHGFIDHGAIVLTSAVRELRKMSPDAPIEVYSANAYIQGKDSRGVLRLKFQFDQGEKALEWMHDNGVRVVVTAFNTYKENESKAFMDKAESLGMIVYAGASNVNKAGKVFPAADPRAISVCDTTPGKSSFSLDPTVDDWVMFGTRGEVPYKKVGKIEDFGSSYASAKLSAYGAYMVWRDPDASRDEIVQAMQKHSEITKGSAGSTRVQMATLDSPKVMSAFVQDVSSRVTSSDVAMMAMAQNGNSR